MKKKSIIKAVNLNKIIDKEKILTVGCATYLPDSEEIELNHSSIGYKYHVDLDRCQTPEELVAWIFHLAGKTWGPLVLSDFIMCFSCARPSLFNGWQIPC